MAGAGLMASCRCRSDRLRMGHVERLCGEDPRLTRLVVSGPLDGLVNERSDSIRRMCEEVCAVSQG